MMLKQLVTRMEPRMFQPMIICMGQRGQVGKELASEGYRVIQIGLNASLPSPIKLAILIRRLRKYQPDILQTWMYHANILGSICKPLFENCRLVWALHASDIEIVGTKWSTRFIAQIGSVLSHYSPDSIVSVSRSGREIHRKLGYDTSLFEIIPNGFNTEGFKPDDSEAERLRGELNLPLNAPVVGHVGRFDPHKDHQTFVRAMGDVIDTVPEVRVLMFGEGVNWENKQLSDWIKQTGHENHFRLLGHRIDVPRLMNLFDLGVSSSRTEAFPLVVGEMMACGVPCVITDVGDSRWLVGETGQIVPPENPTELTKSVKTLLKDASLRNQLGKKARDRIKVEFSISRTVKKYSELYLNLHKNV